MWYHMKEQGGFRQPLVGNYWGSGDSHYFLPAYSTLSAWAIGPGQLQAIFNLSTGKSWNFTCDPSYTPSKMVSQICLKIVNDLKRWQPSLEGWQIDDDWDCLFKSIIFQRLEGDTLLRTLKRLWELHIVLAYLSLFLQISGEGKFKIVKSDWIGEFCLLIYFPGIPFPPNLFCFPWE